ncbi:Nif3-like dinuclear metal center hexameric protein [Sphaerotilus sp.]|uniref:Nif3-like dinuclear metal center hexameric protein n=1 Tax=Sphaerotilus sp. TaxID=2093942 RepID=UPI002ACD99A1|nr:Nif3-like dinuclear metal center hexameric protein [Sphaerotilus sp.]MDZ7856139.1 Nif3-like dinuclear metal center hexameric protein [Sphaerotilus sp.]
MTEHVAHRAELTSHLEQCLEPARFTDYGPNGLQVEGRAEVRRLVSGVTASLALIEAAAAVGADALLVHHGLFWRGQDGRVTGWMKQRLAALLRHDINLYAYHLPLDAHPTLGNNAQLGAHLGLVTEGTFGDKALGVIGRPDDGACTLEAFAARVGTRLGRTPVVAPGDGRTLQRVAWCTGGAQGWFDSAIAAGADVYLTGEISEPQAHIARETGVAFLACGHHATERYGVQALGAHLAVQFGLAHQFIDIDNPG